MSGRGESRCKGPEGVKGSGLLQKRGEATEKAEGQDLTAWKSLRGPGQCLVAEEARWGEGRVKAATTWVTPQDFRSPWEIPGWEQD